MPESDLQSNALGSAAAGIFSRCLTHPLDTAKARLQALPTSPSEPASPKTSWKGGGNGTFHVLRNMARTEGMASWYRGFGSVIIGGTPGTILYLCSYDIIKNRLNEATSKGDGQQESFAVYLASGMLAEAIACIIYVPVDVVKERMQVQSSITNATTSSTRLGYKSSWDALVTISKQEGLSGIYKGYGATLTSFGPFSALYFVFYEDLKKRYREYYSYYNKEKVDGDLPLPWIISSSATAGALASFLTSPLDMAKLRLQVQRGTIASTSSATASSTAATAAMPTIQYRGMIDCLSQVFQQEGIPGLFRGAGARVLHFVPATTVTMTCYESCRSFFYKALNP